MLERDAERLRQTHTRADVLPLGSGAIAGSPYALDREWVAKEIGPIAKPASIVFTDDLPKTRSGKIMRRLLKDLSEHRQLGDVTTLANAEVVSEISGLAESARASAAEE